jgi:signal transduction histidine kinase
VTNAVHYSPAGSVVRLEAVQMHDGRTKVTVSDHGPGLTPEETERVFERFWRSDASRDRDTGGAGLGLAIVARAAEAISAHVAVESVLGEGSEFSLILPRSATP